MTIKKILLVEDDPAELLLLKTFISELFPKARILTVADGYNALVAAPAFAPDAIISDVAMPHADGLSFLHALLPKLLNEPKVLVLTAYDRKQLARLGPLPETASVLHKPLVFDLLAQTVADWPRE